MVAELVIILHPPIEFLNRANRLVLLPGVTSSRDNPINLVTANRNRVRDKPPRIPFGSRHKSSDTKHREEDPQSHRSLVNHAAYSPVERLGERIEVYPSWRSHGG